MVDLLTPIATKLGWDPKDGEPATDQMLRAQVSFFVFNQIQITAGGTIKIPNFLYNGSNLSNISIFWTIVVSFF